MVSSSALSWLSLLVFGDYHVSPGCGSFTSDGKISGSACAFCFMYGKLRGSNVSISCLWRIYYGYFSLLFFFSLLLFGGWYLCRVFDGDLGSSGCYACIFHQRGSVILYIKVQYIYFIYFFILLFALKD